MTFNFYVFVPVRTPPPPAAESCSCDNFWTTFWISFNFGMIVGPDPYIEYLIRFWSIFVATLNFNFQGQMWNLLYLSQKWSHCHEMKTKHIDWTLGHKCDHQAWHLPWPWPWKVKYGICYISQPKVVRRLSVRIYLILTGMTSDVSVPLTHLVQSINQSASQPINQSFSYQGVPLITPSRT